MVDCVCLHCGLTEHTTDENCVCTKCRQTVHTLNDNCVCKKCRTTQHTLNEHCECVVCYETIHTYDGCKCTVCGAQNHTPNDDCICIVCGESAHIVDRNCRCYNCGETHHSIDNHCYCSECDRSFQDTCEERSDGDRYNDNPDIVKDFFANNYYYSTIRKWLNDTFYNTAFNKEQQEKILPTTLINDAESTNPYENTSFWNEGENRFADNDSTTEVARDKIWFLSENEATDPKYSFEKAALYDKERIKETSDYAQCQGAYRDDGGLYDQTGWYRLRSPSCFFSSSVYGVKHMGRAKDLQ